MIELLEKQQAVSRFGQQETDLWGGSAREACAHSSPRLGCGWKSEISNLGARVMRLEPTVAVNGLFKGT